MVHSRVKHFIAIVGLAAALLPVLAQAALLQVDRAVTVSTAAGAVRQFANFIQGGAATVRGTVRNAPNGETAIIDLVFDYRVPRGTIALDELIAGIKLSIETAAGEEVNAAFINTRLIPLNPNRAALSYRATLYYPSAPDASTYVLRVRVFGNYE